MRIERIELNNFGSYEGVNAFDTNSESDQKRIIIIGGKNGAGKTTLFTAIQVCLYGHTAFGYKASGKLYFKEVYNLINSKARMNEDQTAHVKITFTETRIDVDHFEMIRSWTWSNNQVTESVSIIKNGVELTEEEVIDLQNFLLHLIPPELLTLYFFDGEKIADYFLGDQHNNIKDALLILSGNDTYEILYNSVRKLLIGAESDSQNLTQDYADQKETLRNLIQKSTELQATMAKLTSELDDHEAALRHENEVYATRGGISLDEWKNLQKQLHEEEETREHLNAELKSIATDILPFVIVLPLLAQVHNQLDTEQELAAYRMMQKKLSARGFKKTIDDALKALGHETAEKDADQLFSAIQSYFHSPKLEKSSSILNLSSDEAAHVLQIIAQAQNFDSCTVAQYRQAIDESIQRSKVIRDLLQNSSIENYHDHIRVIGEITAMIERLKVQYETTAANLIEVDAAIARAQKDYEATRRLLETEIKKKSVSELSDRMMLLVEELQEQQYRKLLAAVETDLNYKFQQLIRKERFVDHIFLDDSFELHLIRNQEVELETLMNMARRNGTEVLKRNLKERAYRALLEQLHTTPEKVKEAIATCDATTIILPLEVDHSHFSNGEKQILVMALYWALMRQSKNELPFIIDTPFARIDTEHRANITKLLFKELAGQLFVLSTNEELRHEHLEALDEQIAKVYMLEYSEEKRTLITEGNYFEV